MLSTTEAVRFKSIAALSEPDFAERERARLTIATAAVNVAEDALQASPNCPPSNKNQPKAKTRGTTSSTTSLSFGFGRVRVRQKN